MSYVFSKQIPVWLLLLILTMGTSSAQMINISGTVRDGNTGEWLIAANIVDNISQKGAITNEYGFFSLRIPAGEVAIRFQYPGFEEKLIRTFLSRDTSLKVDLIPVKQLKQVSIQANSSGSNSQIQIDLERLKRLPQIAGEPDLVKAIQLLPGFQAGVEGTSGLYVRGGSPDQNLFLLDGVQVYNPSHLFGFLSTFNPDMINKAEALKGGFPARYGGRLASIINIRMKEGNLKEYQTDLSIGLLASRVTFQGPIKKNKSSFIIAARRSLLDLYTQTASAIRANDGNKAGSHYYFHDYYLKLNYHLSDKDKLYLSAYWGQDAWNNNSRESNSQAIDNFEQSLHWRNLITSLRWSRQLGKNTFLYLNAHTNNYQFLLSLDAIREQFETPDQPASLIGLNTSFDSNIQDLGLNFNIDWIPSSQHYIKFGSSYVRHLFTPGAVRIDQRINDTRELVETNQTPIAADEVRLYAEDQINLFEKRLSLNLGVHASLFRVSEKDYFSIEPRISAILILNEKINLQTSYSRMQQYLHLLSNSGLGLPSDLWVPPTELIPPQVADIFSLGIKLSLNPQYSVSLEGYYKTLRGLINYREGASFLIDTEDWQQKVLTDGTGVAKGIELLIEKHSGKLNGWIAFTLAKAERQFDQLNGGLSFPYQYDRRHDISIVFTYELNEKYQISGNWVFSSGAPVTLPSAIYPSTQFPLNTNGFGIPGSSFLSGEIFQELNLPSSSFVIRDPTLIIEYGDLNSRRLPPNHRLDIGLIIKKPKKKREQEFNLGVYNLYNRRNPFFATLDFEKDNSGQISNGRYLITSLFPILPSFSYQVHF